MYTLFDHYYFYDAPFPVVKYLFSIPVAGAAGAAEEKKITIKDLVEFDFTLQDQLKTYVDNKTKKITQDISFLENKGGLRGKSISGINERDVISYSKFGPEEHIDLFNNFYVHPKIIIDLMTHMSKKKKKKWW